MGFEPTHISVVGLKSTALDHSAIRACTSLYAYSYTCPVCLSCMLDPLLVSFFLLLESCCSIHYFIFIFFLYFILFDFVLFDSIAYHTARGKCSRPGLNWWPSAHKTDTLTNWATWAIIFTTKCPPPQYQLINWL